MAGNSRAIRLLPLLLAGVTIALAQTAEPEPALAPGTRFAPGEKPTPWLRYQNPEAREVQVSGAWDRWSARSALQLQGDTWVLDVRPLRIPFGRHEYKFVVNGQWEPGDNRYLYADAEGLLERPSDLITRAAIDDRDEINVYFKRPIPEGTPLRAWLEPEVPLEGWRLMSNRETGHPGGYMLAGGVITFVLDESTYGLTLSPLARVCVAGNFNGWDGSGHNARWRLRDDDDDNLWELSTQLAGLNPPLGEELLLFKFVVDGQNWLQPPLNAPNAHTDSRGNRNLRIASGTYGSTILNIQTVRPLDLSTSYVVAVEGADTRVVRRMASPERVFDTFLSDKELGAVLDPEHRATTYRLFAPRASAVYLNLYDSPYFEIHQPSWRWVEPVERYPLWKDERDGVWEISLLGLDTGKYYAFTLDGPRGDGESFHPDSVIGDPYARAAAHAQNNPIVIDPAETNRWFGGWTDQDYRTPHPKDVVIYETHVRDLTAHPSSGVPPELRGKFMGLIASEGTGTGLDHLKELGVNMLEFLPVAEFHNNLNDYNWGYATTYFFAPEASYGRDPLKGSQYFEFKQMVNELHRRGFGVILDVVYNHVGSPNLFNMIDKKLYFRLNPDYTFSNWSGVGNDFRTESAMARRLIVDNILYWKREHGVDGFRFDLAELIDMDTMRAIEKAVRAEFPDALLISEPWSFRGENKHMLRGTTWSAWNNEFRYAVKDFAMGRGDRERMIRSLFGSVDNWTASPVQAVNYAESHDDMALADELSTAPGHDGRHLIPQDVRANRLCATLIFTSLGIPMINEGQEFLRSKRGVSNTYNRGDELNALNWEDRNRPGAAETLAYYRGLIRLRLSPQGAAFRVGERPPDTYYRWLRPENHHAVGYIVNSPRVHAGHSFVVLANSSSEPAVFEVPLPAGRWKMIGNGEAIALEGLPNSTVVEGPRQTTIRVPGVRSVILMDGF